MANDPDLLKEIGRASLAIYLRDRSRGITMDDCTGLEYIWWQACEAFMEAAGEHPDEQG